MPSKTKAQHNLMAMVANNPAAAKRVGIPQSVGRDYVEADKGRKFNKGGDMKESKAMMGKELAFMKKKGAPKSMIKHEEAEYGMKRGGMARGGLSDLGGYSDGGRLLKGPGDGVSDSIPASIGDRQPARLADGEFVVPARIVSELGNGSTDAGARKLYQMMDRVQKARGKTTGKGKVATNSRADKYLPV